MLLFSKECFSIFLVILRRFHWKYSINLYGGGIMQKISVNGVERNLPESTIFALEAQFEELKNLLNKDGAAKEDAEVLYWLEKFDGNDVAIATVLRQAKLNSLGTEIGLAFLKSKFPCPAKD